MFGGFFFMFGYKMQDNESVIYAYNADKVWKVGVRLISIVLHLFVNYSKHARRQYTFQQI